MFQEMVDRSTVPLPDRDVRSVDAASSSEMENFRIWQENNATTSLPRPNTKVASILHRQKVFGIVTAYPLENLSAK
jgi:hypothetical protein